MKRSILIVVIFVFFPTCVVAQGFFKNLGNDISRGVSDNITEGITGRSIDRSQQQQQYQEPQQAYKSDEGNGQFVHKKKKAKKARQAVVEEQVAYQETPAPLPEPMVEELIAPVIVYGEPSYLPPPIPVTYAYDHYVYEKRGGYIDVVFWKNGRIYKRELWRVDGKRMTERQVDSWRQGHKVEHSEIESHRQMLVQNHNIRHTDAHYAIKPQAQPARQEAGRHPVDQAVQPNNAHGVNAAAEQQRQYQAQRQQQTALQRQQQMPQRQQQQVQQLASQPKQQQAQRQAPQPKQQQVQQQAPQRQQQAQQQAPQRQQQVQQQAAATRKQQQDEEERRRQQLQQQQQRQR